MSYRRLDSPLHAARAGAATAWCLAIAGTALATDHPLVLTALLLCALGGAWRAGVLRRVGTVLLWMLPIVVLCALLNPFFSHEGLTVLARLGEVPVLGQLDLTLEALVYGLVFGLRFLVVFATASLMAATVDPDELLGLFRRVSPRSALTAVVSLRMADVLAADARRIAEAQRCRADAGRAAGRVAVLGSVAQSALDRSLDVAATLEVRGYGTGARARRDRAPWSRHDRHFALSALAIVALTVAAHVAGVASFTPYPSLAIDLDGATLALCAATIVCALLPFADRRGVLR